MVGVGDVGSKSPSAVRENWRTRVREDGITRVRPDRQPTVRTIR